MTSEILFESVLHEFGAARPPDDLLYAKASPSEGASAVPGLTIHKHVSDGHEFAFVRRGKAAVLTPGKSHELSPGKLLLIGRQVEHAESPGERLEPYTMGWCYADHTYARLDHTTFTPPAEWRIGPSIELNGRTDVENIAAAMGAELDHQEYGWARSAQGLLEYFTCILIRRLRRGSVVRLRASESPTISADPRTWRIIQAVLQYCDANYRRNPSLVEVAGAVGYSPSHLSRLMSAHLGCSLSEHLRRLRIEAGRHLLESTDLSVGEIARSLGYGEASHFSHAFSRAQGLSPRAYRDSLRGS
ncbi:MAG: helix-turn-helix transcriptional regulator [Armatimonadetes bacterium]|nr:helix-turn-helix transcriptional regulator [Armatimonadota bacterium]